MVQRFLLVYFPVWGKEKPRKRAFSTLIKKLRNKKELSYDPVRDILDAAFAESLLKLQRITNRLLPTYAKTVLGETENRQKTEAFLLATGLKKLNRDLNDFRFSVLSETIIQNEGRGLREMDSAFSNVLAIFTNDLFKEYNRGYEINLRLADLCSFDYASFLDHFVVNKDSPGIYHFCYGKLALEHLLDLFFLTNGLEIEDSVETVFALFTDQVAISDYGQEDLYKDLESLRNLLSSDFSSDMLADIIRCIKEDPAWEMKTTNSGADIFGDAVRVLTEDYQLERREFLRKRTEQDFLIHQKSLFGDRELLALGGYTQEIGTRLFNGGLPDFLYIRPLRIVKSFIEYFFQRQVYPALNSFFLEAEFVNPESKVTLRDAAEELDGLAKTIVKFEEDFVGASFSKINSIIERAANGFIDQTAKQRAKRTIDDINEEADRIIQRFFSRLALLYTSLMKIQIDMNARNPVLLQNAGTLSISKPGMIADLGNSVDLLEKVQRLLRMFAVDVEKAKENARSWI